MRKCLITLVFAFAGAAFAVQAAPASALTINCEPCSLPYQRWADEAKMPMPDGPITVVETTAEHGCPSRELNYAACTQPSERMIWIAPAMVVGFFPRETFYHELGHNFDTNVLPGWARERFMQILGLEGEWNIPSEPKLYDPSEHFADAYAQCAKLPYVRQLPRLGLGPFGQTNGIGGRVGHNQICRMLENL
jgi:hypothetical protein